jgi:hypothetical protein
MKTLQDRRDLLRRLFLPVFAALAAGLLFGWGAAASVDSARTSTAAVERFLTRSAPALTSYRAVRSLNASTRGGKMQAALRVRTQLDPQQGFSYEVLEATGSSMIQKRVLLAALDTEKQVQVSGTGPRGALTVDNYDFVDPAHADPQLVRVDLKARRKDTMLIDGAMFLAPEDYDLVRVEGALVKRPSFWTRKVSVVRRYGRVAGVRVPLAMESTAHVLIVGASSFAMHYEYEMVNGAPVSPPSASGL